MKVAGIEISHPDKLIFPDQKIKKIDMVRYYEAVAPKMLPYLKNRVLTLHRFPDGIKSQGFYQKNAPDYYPDFIKTIQVETEEGENTQITCNTKKSLIYLVNQGTIGFHIWLSKQDQPYKPDKIVFDLDPSNDSFEKVKQGAKLVKEYLHKMKINPQVMTTGQHGLHVWYKIRRTKTFDDIRPELRDMAEEIEEQHPDLFTTAVRKNKREDKIFIDYLRNAYAQTSVCPFSLRPNKTAGVAMPISWDDLEKVKSADQFTLKSRLKSK